MSSFASGPSSVPSMLPPSPRPPTVFSTTGTNSHQSPAHLAVQTSPHAPTSTASTASPLVCSSSSSSSSSNSTTTAAPVPTLGGAAAPLINAAKCGPEIGQRKRALTDSAEDRERKARTSPSFRSPSNSMCMDAAIRSSNGFQIPVSDSAVPQPPVASPNRARRAHSAMTADSLDNDQEAKLHEIMRAVMIMRIAKTDATPINIVPGLYIGSVGAAISKENLMANGITHVLCAANKIKLYHPNDFIYKQIAIDDTPASDMYSHLASACSFIGRAISAGGRVLVHCFAGKSRSATVIASYLMFTMKIDMVAAIDLMRTKRPIVQPNAGFCTQLLKWNRYIKTLSPKGSGKNKVGVKYNTTGNAVGNINKFGQVIGPVSGGSSSGSSGSTRTATKKPRAPSPLSHESTHECQLHEEDVVF